MLIGVVGGTAVLGPRLPVADVGEQLTDLTLIEADCNSLRVLPRQAHTVIRHDLDRHQRASIRKDDAFGPFREKLPIRQFFAKDGLA